jgi:hypothetical protein
MSCTHVASASTTGSLRLISSTANGGSLFIFQRDGYANGDAVIIQYDAGHVGDDVMSFTPPTVTWLKDGVPVSDTPTNAVGGNGALSTTLSFTFEESDAGVYQCVFTDTSRSEVYVTDPIRLDTGKGSLYHRPSHIHCVLLLLLGETLTIQAISPSLVILRPPEKLVLEVSLTGRYRLAQWARNGAIRLVMGSTFTPSLESFVHFDEVYFVENTTMEDLGQYEIYVTAAIGSGQVAPDVVDVNVVSLGMYHNVRHVYRV